MVVVVPQAIIPSDLPSTGAFRDYLDLRTAVIEHVQRPDIADVFGRLVGLAESRLNRTLRMREQITSTTLTIAGGAVALPTDFAEMIGVYTAGGAEYPQQSSQCIQRGGEFYALEGLELVSQGISGDVAVTYYATLPPLADTLTTSNWLLARYPDVYLYAVGFEAAKYARDGELMQITKMMMDDAIDTAKADDSRARYSRARVRVAGVTP